MQNNVGNYLEAIKMVDKIIAETDEIIDLLKKIKPHADRLKELGINVIIDKNEDFLKNIL